MAPTTIRMARPPGVPSSSLLSCSSGKMSRLRSLLKTDQCGAVSPESSPLLSIEVASLQWMLLRVVVVVGALVVLFVVIVVVVVVVEAVVVVDVVVVVVVVVVVGRVSLSTNSGLITWLGTNVV